MHTPGRERAGSGTPLGAVDDELLARWARAAAATDQGDPFCGAPAWQLAFHETVNPERPLLVRAGKDGVLAFATWTDPSGEMLLVPVERLWLFGCPLLGEAAVGLLEEADATLPLPRSGFSKIIVSGLRPGGPTARRLLARFRFTHEIYAYPTGTQCGASLAGGLDGYLSRRSANHRRNLKREQRRIRDRGVSFERVLPASPVEAAATYSRIIAVELQSWKGRARCGMESGFPRRFYERLLHRLMRLRAGRVLFARQEDRDIGFVLGGLAGSVYRGQQFSYADDWKEYSVGNLMQLEQIAWLCEEGATRYDLGPITGEKMGYKSHWAELRFPLEAWALVRR